MIRYVHRNHVDGMECDLSPYRACDVGGEYGCEVEEMDGLLQSLTFDWYSRHYHHSYFTESNLGIPSDWGRPASHTGDGIFPIC